MQISIFFALLIGVVTAGSLRSSSVEFSSIEIRMATETCGDELYDPTESICCDGVLSSLSMCGSTSTSDVRCCGKRAFTDTRLACCGGTLDLKQGDRHNNACCGGFSFDQTTHMCCQGTFHPKPKGDEEELACCRTRAYSKAEFTCDDGVLVEV
ncbi:hypothetical protein CAPTEDRAFT_228631 [Capitella teleta]|uniref:Galaxin-like repeats domain-containing protein n=1 Tax=Capitella teleta TaxID=283909 RepID=R7UEZ8_CAPTE|nr:hypothetical protein CAPTEDRAFT_228631 [Capitella teleta]|eukprot:ELU05094.1 hypothetical protein CAPTEDRAFT_228631 [Capitella teleta]